MRNIIKTIKMTMLYAVSLVLVAAMPMTTFAQEPSPESVTPSAIDSEEAAPVNTDPITSESPLEQVVPEQVPAAAQAPAEIQSQPPQQQPEPPAITDDTADTQNTAADSITINDSVIHTTENSVATSGDAQVKQNTTAGNAETGNASTQTTIVNSVHSTISGGDATSVAHFTTDIHGNVYGDITITPSINEATRLQNANTGSTAAIDSSTGIANTVTATATTGDAIVDSNTNAGNATTGNAHAVANIMNLINTIIAANQSFVGTINIYGDLNGDILVSPEFIPQLLDANQGSMSADASLSSTVESNQQIINTIQLNATTGSALVDSNTNAGSATTGTASTNLTVLNLTGREVTAANSLLVFVNVLGTWVGMIVDAPVGTTSALIGNGVTHNAIAASSSVAVTDSAAISNNVDLSAVSGDASVTRNTNAGNATSGNATASANIANIATSTFSISDWFGVLFINVFGSWHGSFGINTANGDIIPLNGDAVVGPAAAHQTSPPFQFGFTPKPTGSIGMFNSFQPRNTVASTNVATNTDESNEPSAELASATLGDSTTPEMTPAGTMRRDYVPRSTTADIVMILVGLGITLLGVGMAGYRRFA